MERSIELLCKKDTVNSVVTLFYVTCPNKKNPSQKDGF